MADFSGSFTENFRTIISEKNSSRVRTSAIIRSSPSEMFLGKGVLKICSKLKGEHLCRSAK